MRRKLGVGLVLVAGIAACSSTPAPPTPTPTVAPSAWDPRRDQIDQAEAIWAKERPAAYAYTFDHAGPPGDGQSYRYRVSGLEGGTQLLHVSGQRLPDPALGTMTVEGLYGVARDSLASDAFSVEFDRQYGNPGRLSWSGAAEPSAGGAVETVGEFTTAGARDATTRARTALEAALTRWGSLGGRTWEYTWSRIPAGSAAGEPTVWAVKHANGRVTAKRAGGDLKLAADEVTPEGTARAIQNLLVSGGWADVAVQEAPGLDVLIAVDPQPGAKGDAYWIRLAWTDLARRAALADLETAKARWARSQPKGYAYLWRYTGDGGDLTYRVERDGDAAKVTPQGGTPSPEARSHATPRIEDTFAMIEAVLAQGGTVKATYDDRMGYPTRVEMNPNGDAGAKGVITIRNLKRG